jgi:predicted ATPase
MIVGITGAHRTGKTTLARAFVEANPEFAFVPTSVGAIMAQHGFDPLLDYPIEERLQIQNIILTELDRAYAQHASNAVFDRTPLDAAAYFLADVLRENVGEQLQWEITQYVARAIDITNRRFSMLFFVPPVLPYVAEPGKAPAQPAYIEHISTIINGLRADERQRVRSYLLQRNYTDLHTRVKCLEVACGKLLNAHQAEMDGRADFAVVH